MPHKTNDFDSQLPVIHRKLHAWYQNHGRTDLPWRNTQDAYAIYISEVMLQQTQVATVLTRYYPPFLKQFPTLAALARAPLHDVLKAWEGLGYYRRAKNLHAAAQQSGGVLPDTVEELLELPGIGQNTAHAVACFGFMKAVPVMEANLKRVLHRIFALPTANDALLWEKAWLMLDRKRSFNYNQAMMDIGALICTPRAPKCSLCPLRSLCAGQSNPELFPAAKKKQAVPVQQKNIIVFHTHDKKYFLAPRKAEFLSGLYGFYEVDRSISKITFGKKQFLLSSETLLGQIKQTYSHFTLQAHIHQIEIDKKISEYGYKPFSLKEIKALPLSRAESKILALL